MGLKLSDERLMEFFVELMQKNDVPQSSYGLKGYGEDRTCLEKVNGKWQVYYGCRGHKEDLCEYADLIAALKDIADRCSDSEEALNKITNELKLFSKKPKSVFYKQYTGTYPKTISLTPIAPTQRIVAQRVGMNTVLKTIPEETSEIFVAPQEIEVSPEQYVLKRKGKAPIPGKNKFSISSVMHVKTSKDTEKNKRTGKYSVNNKRKEQIMKTKKKNNVG